MMKKLPVWREIFGHKKSPGRTSDRESVKVQHHFNLKAYLYQRLLLKVTGVVSRAFFTFSSISSQYPTWSAPSLIPEAISFE